MAFDFYKYANKAAATLGIPVTTPPYAVISSAIIASTPGGTLGTLAAYSDKNGNLVVPVGITLAGSTIAGGTTITGTSPNLTLASGQTNTGQVIIKGKTSGELIITTSDATLENVTVNLAAQTTGNSTLTIPNFAGVNDTFAFVTLTQTLASKTLTGAGSIISTAATGNGVGFGTGAGGTVTQITGITTGVTLSKPSGQITTVSSTLAAGASAVFTVTNTLVAATDTVIPSVGTYAGTGTPVAHVKNVVAGAYDVVLQNVHASAALNAAVLINVNVFKGVTS